ncbi:hypothetical protein K2X05_15220 [bacterium]|nr:hypothetical protein [bacterium]
MEFERHVDLSSTQTTSKERIPSSLRMKYSAEVQLIINKWGDLEQMRKTLGLSQRKICQLLLVDPSAWTRWTRNPESSEAPPHVFRALSWYLLLLNKSPELSPYVFLQTVARPQIPQTEIQKATEQIEKSLHTSFMSQIKTLQKTNQRQKIWLLVISSLLIGYIFLSMF